MSLKGTRSTTNLPGIIQNYLVENSDTGTTLPDPVDNVGGAAATEADDMKSMLVFMTKTFTAITEGRSSAGSSFPKMEECPQKRASSSLDAWMQEVILWDESNTGNTPGLNAK